MKNLKSLNKIFWLLIALSASAAVFNACGDDNDEPGNGNGNGNQSLTEDPGVVINGVKWATRNVDAPGTFAATPESPGKFYQWNRKVAWSATEPGEGIPMPNWDSSMPTGTEWIRANDPSPAGWRIPNLTEIERLLDTDRVSSQWTTQNDVNGRKFTDRTTGNSLFLPAVGCRFHLDGVLYSLMYGGYWSGMQYDSHLAYLLDFSIDYAERNCDNRHFGFSVRSVTE